MSRSYKIYDQADLQFITYATVGWVDVFTRPLYKDILIESLHSRFDQRDPLGEAKYLRHPGG